MRSQELVPGTNFTQRQIAEVMFDLSEVIRLIANANRSNGTIACPTREEVARRHMAFMTYALKQPSPVLLQAAGKYFAPWGEPSGAS